MKSLLPLLLLFMYSNLSAQIKITNQTGRSFTNLYIIDSDSTLKTESFCDYILNKNLLTKRLDSSKSVSINVTFPTDKYYNVICFDTAWSAMSYSSVTFKYHVSGKTKQIILVNNNVEADFNGHCMEGTMVRDLEDLDLTIENRTTGNLIKVYIKFDESGTFKRYTHFHQWNPITKGSTRKITLYNFKPKDATTIYFKYYTETAGIIKEHTSVYQIQPNQKNILFIIQ